VCPPEDVGGVHGFVEFLPAIRDRRHPEHASYLELVGQPYDPALFDLAAANAALRRFQPRRRTPAGEPASPPEGQS